MNEVTQLAQEAMAVLTPLLPMVTSLAGHMADGFLSQPGAKLFDWLSRKVKGTPAEATLARAVAEPSNTRRTEALQLEIEDLAEEDEAFKQELRELLKAVAGSTTANQTAAAVGDSNRIAQVTGTNNKVRIG